MAARALLNCFSADAGVTAHLVQLHSRYRPWLADALEWRADWDGEHQTLEDALWLGYRGFEDLDAIEAFGEDSRAAGPDMTRAIDRCNAAMGGWGIRANWAGALLFAALLRHTLREGVPLPGLVPAHVALWPAGTSLITELPPEFTPLSWNRLAESGPEAKERMHRAIEGRFDEIEQEYVRRGHVKVSLRNVRRDAEATHLRLLDPRTWTWSALDARYSGAQPEEQLSGAMRLAVRRFAHIVGVELSRGANGRPGEDARV